MAIYTALMLGIILALVISQAVRDSRIDELEARIEKIEKGGKRKNGRNFRSD